MFFVKFYRIDYCSFLVCSLFLCICFVSLIRVLVERGIGKNTSSGIIYLRFDLILFLISYGGLGELFNFFGFNFGVIVYFGLFRIF